MAAEDAVFTAAVARDEVRKSLNRMEYHLTRGQRGILGVQREVNFLNALGRQSARLGAATAAGTNVTAKGTLGDRALRAMAAQSGGNRATAGRLKSSLLAEYSQDTMSGARDWTYNSTDPWVWITNASACPACLDEHGKRHSGPFVPMHPSCLCYPEQTDLAKAKGVEQLTPDQMVNTLQASNNPAFAKVGRELATGRLSTTDAARAATRRSKQGVRRWLKALDDQAARADDLGNPLPIPEQPAKKIPSTEEAAAGELEPQLKDFGRFDDNADYNRQYAAAKGDDALQMQIIQDFKEQERLAGEARRAWARQQEVAQARNMPIGTDPQQWPKRDWFNGLKNDFEVPTKKYVTGVKVTDEFGNFQLELTENAINKRVKALIKQYADDSGAVIDDDVIWTANWDEWWKLPHTLDHTGAEAFVVDGKVYLSPSIIRDIGRASFDDAARSMRVVAHELAHTVSSSKELGLLNTGLRPIMEEAAAEINSIFWARYRWADELLDGIKTRVPTADGTEVVLKGADAMYMTHNYSYYVEETILQSVRRNGWNPQAVLDDIMHVSRKVDMEDFFRGPVDADGRARDVIRIEGSNTGARSSRAPHNPEAAKASMESVWAQAPDDIGEAFAHIDPTKIYNADEVYDGVTTAQFWEDKKRVAGLLHWLMEGAV